MAGGQGVVRSRVADQKNSKKKGVDKHCMYEYYKLSLTNTINLVIFNESVSAAYPKTP
jgi:hypothetical protein